VEELVVGAGVEVDSTAVEVGATYSEELLEVDGSAEEVGSTEEVGATKVEVVLGEAEVEEEEEDETV
jgi:hypothetical protein